MPDFLHPLELPTVEKRPEDEAGLEQRITNAQASALCNSTVAELCANGERLVARGVIASANPTQVDTLVQSVFEQFFGRDHRSPDGVKREAYRRLVTLLVFSGAARLNTLCDWSVTHVDDCIDRLEELLAARYHNPERKTPMRHLHQGSGNNVGVYKARKDRRPYRISGNDSSVPRCEVTEQIGMGDVLYFPLELQQFTLASEEGAETWDARRRDVQRVIVRILTEALQRKLHARWYKPGTTIETSWRPRVTVRDMNDMFSLLARPSELLDGIYLRDHMPTFSFSREFPGDERLQALSLDQQEHAGLAAHAWLLKYTGNTSDIMREELRIHTFNMYQRRHGRGGRLTTALRKRMRARDFDAHREELQKECSEAFGWTIRDGETIEEVLQHAEATLGRYKQHIDENRIPIELGDLEQKILWLRELRAVESELKKHPQDQLPPRRLIAIARKHIAKIPEQISIQGLHKLVCDEMYSLSRQFRVDDEDVLLDASEQESRLAPEEKLLRLVFMGKHLPDCTDSLEEVFVPEFVQGVRNSHSYAKAQYRRSQIFQENAIQHIHPNRPPLEPIDVKPEHVVKVGAVRIEEDEMQHVYGWTFRRTRGQIHVIPDMNSQPCTIEVIAMLDLNEHAVMYPQGFVSGKFADVSTLFPPESFRLISARKSHSHLGEIEFLQLLQDNIRLLEPGGCIDTDGIRASYSRVLRLAKSSDNLRCTVLLDGATCEPVRLLLQRAHEDGFLTLKEIEGVYGHRYEARPPEQIRLRTDIAIAEEVRRRLAEELGPRGFHRFQKIHPQLQAQHDPLRQVGPERECLDRLLIRAGADVMLRENPELIDDMFVADMRERAQVRLKEDVPEMPSVENLQRLSLWSIAHVLCKKPTDLNTPAGRDGPERVVADAVAFALFRRSTKTERKPTSAQRTAIKEGVFLRRARNLDYEEPEPLDTEQIHYITHRLLADIRTALQTVRKR
jgi:hypothetical protein